MNRRRPFTLIFLLLICGMQALRAQDLAIISLDASRFPEMRARFIAAGADGNVVAPAAAEISLTDNGSPVTDFTVACALAERPVPLSSVLVVDVSGSMRGGNIEIARAGAHAWINALSAGRSECAITSFDEENYLNQDFTTDHTLLHTAVDKLIPRGNTLYDKGLLLPNAGGLFVSARGRYRRVIVFLTDGRSNDSLRTDEVIAEARRQGAVIYPVTLGFPCPEALRDVARQTGGEWFEQVTTVAEIEKIYRMLALIAQNPDACEVTWRSADLCTDASRVATLGWRGSGASRSYQPDSTALQSITVVPESAHIQPRTIGLPVDLTITVTATIRAAVRSVTSSNPAFTITPTTFWLDAGESTTLTVRYTPTDSGYQWTTFTLLTDDCSRQFSVSAGYPRSRPSARTLMVISPNGGEEFVAGTSRVITWTGIPPADRATIEYSSDDGATWTNITTEATGGSYTWLVPNTPSPICRVRVMQTSNSEGEWARSIGSSGADGVNGVVVDAQGNSYICGRFSGTLQIGTQTLTSRGEADLFIARYGPDGAPLWAVRGGGPHPDDAYSIALDDAGNIVVGGVCGIDGDIGPLRTPASPIAGHAFVAKLRSDGSFIWARTLGTTSLVRSVDVDGNGEICAGGRFGSPGALPIDFGGVVLTPLGTVDAFLAKLRDDGSLIWVRQIGGTNGREFDDEITRVRFDRDGDIVIVGAFNDTVDFGGSRLASAGQRDIFVARYSGSGVAEWARRGGGTSADKARALAIDSIGDIYVGGEFHSLNGTATFDHIGMPAHREMQMFLAKYHADGSIVQVYPITGEFAGTDPPHWFAPTYTVEAIAIDGLGDIYYTASFKGNTPFQGRRLQSHAVQNIAVVRLRPDGESIWARRAGSWSTGNFAGSDYSRDIAIAPDGSIFVVGSVDSSRPPADFGRDTLTTTGRSDGFLWKIDYSVLQSDLSDGPFAIVAPEAASQNVHLEPVPLGRSRDSVVASYIRNTGTYDLVVQSITFEGPDAGYFSLVSGSPPLFIAAGASSPVEFRFKPERLGLASAFVNIVIAGDTLRQMIFGEAVEPTVEVLSDIIDFGRVPVGDTRDSIQAITIANRGAAPLTLSGIRHDGPNAVDFTTLAGTTPTLLPGDTLHLDLRFAPARVGRTSGRLLFEFDGIGSPASVLLFGEGVSTTPASASLLAASFEARAGDEVDLPITFAEQTNLQHSGATSIAARLRFNATLLYPLEISPSGSILDVGEIVDGERDVTIEMPLPGDAAGELGRIRFVALLGNDSTTAVTLEDAVSIGGEVSLTSRRGEFRLLDLCYDGGARLFNPDGQTAILKVQQLPGGLTAEVEIETVERGEQRLVLVDILGREVVVLADGEQREGRQHYTIDTRSLPTGSYYLVLTTPTVRRVARLNVSQ